MRISGRQPEYPEELRQRGIEGTVVLEALVSQDGVLQELKVVRSSDAHLTDRVFDAVRTWRYRPALCDGNPIAVTITTTSSFKAGSGG